MQISFRKTGEIWQWDRNRRLICIGMDDPVAWQVHFSAPHDEEGAYVLLPYRADDGKIYVNIPNVLLQAPGVVAVYGYHVATEEKLTHNCYTFCVHRREMPADYVYTETEVWDWQAISHAETVRAENESERRLAEETRTAAEAARAEAEAARDSAEENRELAVRMCLEAAIGATADADIAAANAREAAENVKDGYTPVKGVDYFTEADKEEIADMIEVPAVDRAYTPESTNAQSGIAVAEGIARETAWKTLVDFTLAENQAEAGAILIEIPEWERLKTASRIRIEADIKAGETEIASQRLRISISDENFAVFLSFFCYRLMTCAVGATVYYAGRFEISPLVYEDGFRRYAGYVCEPSAGTGANASGSMYRIVDRLNISGMEKRQPYLVLRLDDGGIFGAGTRIRMEVC